jgi:hypothetical protein
MCGRGTENWGVWVSRGDALVVGEKNPSTLIVLRKVEGEKGIVEEGEGDAAAKDPFGMIIPGDFSYSLGVWKISCALGGEPAFCAPLRLRLRRMLGGEMMPMRALVFGLNMPLNGDAGVLPPGVRLNFGDWKFISK